MSFFRWSKRRSFVRKTEEMLTHLSLEEVVSHKLEQFFVQLGTAEATGLYRLVMQQVERPLIRSALAWAKGNQLKAARLLGLSRNTLRKKIRELEIKK